MPAPKKKAVAKKPALSAKDLQKKVEELTETSERLTLENEEIKIKFRLICEKIANNMDTSVYEYMKPNTEPENIDIGDLLHMVQTLALMAINLKSEEADNQMDGLEMRMNELTDVDSKVLKEKFKLQERLVFIKQERDVWKKNAEEFKKMYIKLVKEQEKQPLKVIGGLNIESYNPRAGNQNNKLTLEQNTHTIKKSTCCKNCKPQVTTKVETTTKHLTDIQNKPPAPPTSPIQIPTDNYFQKEFTESQEIEVFPADESSINNENNTDQQRPPSAAMIRNLNRKKFEGIPNDMYRQRFSVDSSNIDLIEKPLNSNRKNVSFNKEIDVGIYRKDSKNLKLIESYLKPLPVQTINIVEQKCLKDALASSTRRSESPSVQKIETTTYMPNSTDVHDHIKNLLNNNRQALTSINPLFSIVNRRTSSPLSSNSTNESRYTNRASICSMRKFPGETPVKNLEPTLKMIIIKELSVHKNDGNDWRMFAKRIGISESEVKEWENLKLQYPMARVLSFWSSSSDATTRLLHKHLNAPCFNYSVLAKRIENFYDVVV